MARLQRKFTIRAPMERVWRVLVDPELQPEWEAGVVGVENASGPLDEVDASCTQAMVFRRRTLSGELRVVEAWAPHTRVVRVQPPLTREALRRERLVETDTGTELMLELNYETAGGPLGAVLNVILIRPRLAMMLAESARNLRRLVETEL